MSEKIKSLFDMELGCYILSLYGVMNYDLIDVFSVVNSNFIPATYICSRECYTWS